jgi:hypothetical protein
MKEEEGDRRRLRSAEIGLFRAGVGTCAFLLLAAATAGDEPQRALTSGPSQESIRASAGLTHAVILAQMPKNNSACLVCHINFEKELLVSTHLKKGITCARCHGVSYDHMNDEEAVTKPDVLFGRSEVDPFCRKCHKEHRNPAAVAKFLAEWKGRRRPHRRLIRPNAICTDCHGEHRIGQGGPR